MSPQSPSTPLVAVPVADVATAPFSASVDLPSGRVTVAGEFDRGNAHRVLDALDALAGTGHPQWTLDARSVSFCDAEGLRALVVGHRAARQHGRTLSVLPSPCVHRLVLLVGLDQLLVTPPPSATVLTDVADCVRTRRALAAVRDVRRPTSVPGAAGVPG